MNKEMVCKNCKYHYIEEISFDYPQSCCDKRKAVIEEWFNCNDFEYSDRYIKQLQQENKKLKDNWNKLKEYIKQEPTLYFYNDKLPFEVIIAKIINKMKELERGVSDVED